jgi:general secretion pathway protein L
VTTDVLGEGTSDPQRATDLLDKTATGADEDPLPHADAFDVMVQIAQAVPENMTHDIEELDVQRGHVTVHGIVPTIPDAQQIATQLKSIRCFQDVKITRTNQVVGEERQKYVMELDVKCPVEGKEKPAAGAPAASASGGKP